MDLLVAPCAASARLNYRGVYGATIAVPLYVFLLAPVFWVWAKNAAMFPEGSTVAEKDALGWAPVPPPMEADAQVPARTVSLGEAIALPVSVSERTADIS